MAYQQNHHRRAGHKGGGVSLFPFLAVLLCTMGAMIVLLMLIARQAQLQGAEAEDTQLVAVSSPDIPELPDIFFTPEEHVEETLLAPSEEELLAQRERMEQEKQRLEMLQDTRETQRRTLEESRGALAAAQTEVQRLSEEARQLSAAAMEMQKPENPESTRELKMKISELELEIEKLEEGIRVAESNAKERDGSYAVVPYVGPGGTRRYPLYIECREDGAYLMPENIQLSRRDFEGVLSRGNPLEATLMAKREYLRQTGVFQETEGGIQEPYPLMIVRPEGIPFLYMSREALKSWDTEYGYELVDGQMKIAYPPVDETLKQQMQAVLSMARNSQEQLSHAAPTLSGLAGGTHSESGAMAFRSTGGGGGAPINIDADSRLARTLRNSSRRPSGVMLGGGTESRGAGTGMNGGAGGANNTGVAYSGSGGGAGIPDYLVNSTNSADYTLPAVGANSAGTGQITLGDGKALHDKPLYATAAADYSDIPSAAPGTPPAWFGSDTQKPDSPATDVPSMRQQMQGGIQNPELYSINTQPKERTPEEEALEGAEPYILNEELKEKMGREFRTAERKAELKAEGRRKGAEAADALAGLAVGLAAEIAVEAAADSAAKGVDNLNAKLNKNSPDPPPCPNTQKRLDYAENQVKRSDNDRLHTYDWNDPAAQRELQRQQELQRQRTAETKTANVDPSDYRMAGPPPYGDAAPGDSSGSAYGQPGDSTTPTLRANQKQETISDTKGTNWALDHYRASQVPLSRPIRVECYPDRYVIPGSGDVSRISIPHTTPYKNMTQLAKEVGKHVESWGAPGPGMYWRPKLRVTVVADGGETRLHEMITLLQNSGLEVEEIRNEEGRMRN